MSASDRGRGLFLLAVFFQSLMEAAVKWAAPTAPIELVVFYRVLFAFPPIVLFLMMSGGLSSLAPRSLFILTLRALAMYSTMFLFFESLQHMPLANATALFFLAPFFMYMLGTSFFRGAVQVADLTLLGVAFVGSLFILRPDLQSFDWYGLYPVLAAFAYALSMQLTKHMQATETRGSLLLSGNGLLLMIALIGLVLSPRDVMANEIAGNELALLVAIGVVGGVTTILFVLALNLSTVVEVAPIEYMALPFAIVLGYLLWSEMPSASAIAGTLLIAAASYVQSQSAKRRELRPATLP